MKILFVSYSPPEERFNGASQRSNNLWRALRDVAEVRSLVLMPAKETRRVHDAPPHEVARIHFVNPPFLRGRAQLRAVHALIREALAGERFDFVVVRYARLAMLVKPCVDAPVLLDADDLSKTPATLGKSAIRRVAEAARMWARTTVTRAMLSRWEHVWYVNPQDMARFPVRSGSLLPNVVEIPAESPHTPDPMQPTIVMVGTFGYEPNIEGADFLVNEVMPLLRRRIPQVRLKLIGRTLPAQTERWGRVDGVQACGYVDDLAAEYRRASVVVAPIFSGGGTQIKVLDALAHGCGLVGSEMALSGFAPDLQPGMHALMARSPEEWAERCADLIRDPLRAAALGRAGRQVVAARYSQAGLAAEVARTLRAKSASRGSD